MDLKLNGKLALVTGSTAGIGRAIATSLAKEGVHVVVNGRTKEAVDEAIAALKKETSGTIHGFHGDLSDAKVVTELAQKFPNVDILVNNLATFEIKEFQDITDADWMKIFEVNVLGGVRLSRIYLPYMRKSNWGRVIFISSESALQIPTEMIHYGVTKAAQIAVARGLAETVAGTGITINSVLPGPTRSRAIGEFIGQMAESSGKSVETVESEFFEKIRPSSLIKRFAAPDEVASLVCYLASPLSSATTGSALRVDGGVVKSAF